LFDKKNLREAFDLAGIASKPVFVHAEDEECLIKNKSQEKNLADHCRYRPSVCEEISIKDVLNSSENLSTKIHICHLSSGEGVELLKNRPRNISCGVTPHHSLLSIEKELITPGYYKVNPPIRTSFDKELLFNAVKNGVVDIIESDHAPHTRDEKGIDFDEAPSGIPGVETMYPLFLYLVKKEVLSFQRLISLLCVNPSNLLNIPKGRIEVGCDADFIIVDLKEECRIKSDKLHSRCGWSPFEDWPAIFPECVFIRGEKIIEDNEIQVKQGFGEFVGA
jgi:dihydroorotase